MPRRRELERALAEARESEERERDDARRMIQDRARTRLNGELRATIRHLERENEELTDQVERFLHLAAYEPRPFKIKPKTRREAAAGMDRCVAIALASDWHMEERVATSTVNGLNEYNPEIAQERAGHFFRNLHRLIDINRGGARIEHLCLWLGGDFISGHIHPELVESNWLAPIPATELVYDTLVSGIDYLLAKADLAELFIPTSHGNHGRTTDKRRHSTGAANSHEHGLYVRLAKHYAHEPRVQFQIADGALNYVTRYGDLTLRFSHGDYVRYAGGVGGVSIPLNKAIGRWNTQPESGGHLPRPATCDFLGHFHGYEPGANYVRNGSLIGWNAYAISIKASYEEPQQAFCMANLDAPSGHRIIGHFPIRVTA